MPLFSEIAKIIRRGKNNRKSNYITKAIAKEQALKDIAASTNKSTAKSKVNPNNN